jgi:hypothetical protein
MNPRHFWLVRRLDEDGTTKLVRVAVTRREALGRANVCASMFPRSKYTIERVAVCRARTKK